MLGLNGTGPTGQGSMTGRGAGRCGANGDRGEGTPAPELGGGLGRGTVAGAGRGRRGCGGRGQGGRGMGGGRR